MDDHRLVQARNPTLVRFEQPFSSFTYVDQKYGGANPAIRRLFSIARSHAAQTLMVEEIDPAGIICDENGEIERLYADYQMKGLQRISFWRSSFETIRTGVLREEDCIGYAILKRDAVPSKKYDRWHVFEAVFEKYQHKHNCIPNPMEYSVALGTSIISLRGLLYAQQNTLNKVCAHVALRSVISRAIGRDVSYSEINKLSRQVSSPHNPSNGLNAEQIRVVLEGFKIGFRDFDYTSGGPDDRSRHPYRRYVYSGVESGAGALLGFRLGGPNIQGTERHIIPFYGHTFNKDTWIPEADMAYFQVGEDIGYVPSESWTSSFLGHDDNFGPCFCIPRLYVPADKVDYVVELLRPRVRFGGAEAEALGLLVLYSILNQLDHEHLTNNIWLKRFAEHVQHSTQTIVLRAIAVERDVYIQHLSDEPDWDDNRESAEMVGILTGAIPEVLWVVEVSVPQLFAANERKLGDIVLSGKADPIDHESSLSAFLFARLPGLLFFSLGSEHNGERFLTAPSRVVSHLPVIRLEF